MEPDHQKKLIILAGDTDDNIGDRAIVYSMCNELRNLDPRLRIASSPKIRHVIERILAPRPFLAASATSPKCSEFPVK